MKEVQKINMKEVQKINLRKKGKQIIQFQVSKNITDEEKGEDQEVYWIP
jgi:hypothetical protein